ncbi:hypothetical protein [uncultured Shewanella sp.]|uniref:hypothetical protein n=1 Tax=uncultured Shewanella sp. TaxID=173975 RepID=UPI002609A547|nr:hypothetical protein [uncultured Shewanella sp.]
MHRTKMSHHQVKSKLTLSLVFLIFVCQFFASCVSAHNQYPQSGHEFNVMKCHFHDSNSLSISLTDFNNDDDSDHEHDFHSHTSCHPPVEMDPLATFPKSHGIAFNACVYQARRYAPPVRPPHSSFLV